MAAAEDLAALEQTLGITFQDRSRLSQALTHRSHLNENPKSRLVSNERLEFLGDAILDFLAAEFLYQQHARKEEGELTLLRSALVRTETLADLSTRLDLGRYLILGRGEEAEGGRDRPTILADTFEAILGAIYLDQGIETTRTFLRPFLEQEMKRLRGSTPIDAKSALQITVQGRLGITPHYRTITAWGPEHARTFREQVLAGDRVLGQGEGHSKQAAQQEAARIALKTLREEA